MSLITCDTQKAGDSTGELRNFLLHVAFTDLDVHILTRDDGNINEPAHTRIQQNPIAQEI